MNLINGKQSQFLKTLNKSFCIAINITFGRPTDHGTPLTSSSMHAKIGYKADGYAVDLILSGEYVEDDEMTAATSLLIHHLQAKTAEEIQTTITKEEVLGKLKKWKESTTTSPSGLHLGHYHCAWQC